MDGQESASPTEAIGITARGEGLFVCNVAFRILAQRADPCAYWPDPSAGCPSIQRTLGLAMKFLLFIFALALLAVIGSVIQDRIWMEEARPHSSAEQAR